MLVKVAPDLRLHLATDRRQQKAQIGLHVDLIAVHGDRAIDAGPLEMQHIVLPARMHAELGSDAFGKFDKLEAKVEKQEAEADAFAQLAGENTSLEDQFKQLESGSGVDDELASLKAQLSMGSQPAGQLTSGSDTK